VKVIVCGFLVIDKVFVTLLAAAVVRSPACEAVIEHVPAATALIAPEVTVQIELVDVEKLTGKEGPALLVATNT